MSHRTSSCPVYLSAAVRASMCVVFLSFQTINADLSLGWTPSTFVSSRQQKAEKHNARPEDFMDEEVMREKRVFIQPINSNRTDEMNLFFKFTCRYYRYIMMDFTCEALVTLHHTRPCFQHKIKMSLTQIKHFQVFR